MEKWEKRDKKRKNKGKHPTHGKGMKRVMIDLYWKRKQEKSDEPNN